VKHPVLPRGAELSLPVVSAVLLTLSFPPFHLLVPPFIALVPYLVFVGRAPQDAEGTTSVRRATFWMGVVFYGTLLYWLFAALVYYTWLALLGYFITVVVLAILLSGAGWAIHVFRSRFSIPFWVSVPVFWTAVEWLRAHLGEISFPWLGLGHSLTGFPWAVGFADITGARGVSVWLLAINGVAAEWWTAGVKQRARRYAPALALLIALPLAYSLVRWSTLDMRPAARVLVVQPNVPEDLKLDRQAAKDSARVSLGALTMEAVAADTAIDLMVWPEAALPDFYTYDRDWSLWAASTARRQGKALLFGTLDLKRGANSLDYYNAALYLDRSGSNAGVYRKHKLVPVAERVPFVPTRWIHITRLEGRDWRLPLLGNVGSLMRWFGGYSRGNEQPLMEIDESGFGVLICYESIFPGLSRSYRRGGADFLVNITNDAWFGRQRPWWSRTSALQQHPAHLVMRAIENRIGIARSGNTGVSMFVDPRGAKHEVTDPFVADARAADVMTTDGTTLYTRLGDWPGWLAAAGAVLLLLYAWWQAPGGFSRWIRRREA
jgi:apolipoprotein N-acyltransferase